VAQNLKRQGADDATIQEIIQGEMPNISKKAESQVRASLLVEAVAKQEKIELKQADFDAKFKEAQFAIGTADQKLNDAVLQQAPPGEATNTVDRTTVDAAATRVVGNDKVPTTDYGNEKIKTIWLDRYKEIRAEVIKQVTALIEINNTVNASLDTAANTSTLTKAEISALAGRLEPISIALFNASDDITTLRLEIFKDPGNYPNFQLKLEKLEANVKENRNLIDRVLRNFKRILKQIQDSGA
jgi:hypothetical protein